MENIEEVHITHRTIQIEQETHESTHFLVRCHEYKTKAWTQCVTVFVSLRLETEEHDDAKEVLNQNEGDDGQD